MTRKEEKYLLDSIGQIRIETHENNIMLRAIVQYLANEAVNADAENMHDFGRNVLANMISNLVELQGLNR